MDLYFNQQKISVLPIQAKTTIGQLKRSLGDWLMTRGIGNYTVRLIFNNGTELSPTVFQNNNYDAVDFSAHKDLLKGGSIYVSVVPVKPVTKIEPGPENVYIVIDESERGAAVSVHKSLDGAIEYILGEIGENFHREVRIPQEGWAGTFYSASDDYTIEERPLVN